jgi:O-antigen ligase
MRRHGGAETPGALGAEDVLLLAAVVGLPWFWGGVNLAAYRTAAAVVASAAGWALFRRGFSGLAVGRGTLWLLPALLLGAFAFAQTVPLPRSWVAALSPKAASIQAGAFGPEGQPGAAWLRQIEDDARARVPEAASALAGDAGGLDLGPGAPAAPNRFTLSLQPGATLERAFWYAALLLAFLLASGRAVNERRGGVYRATLFVSFVVLAVVGILNHLAAPDRLLWLRVVPEGTRPFGPYVNPDHFAGAMELAIPWLLGYGLDASAQRSAADRVRARWILAVAGAVICGAAALLAASKMGSATIGVACVVLIAVATRRGRGRRFLFAGTVSAAVLLGAVAFYGPLRERIHEFAAVREGIQQSSSRVLAWTAGIRMAEDYPLAGSGFGAFSDVIPGYLPRGDSASWLQMHNDYLEVYLAGGLIAAALVVWLALAFMTRLGRVVRSGLARDRGLSSLGLALGLFALAVHEAVDFNLQVPANALLFVVIAAMGVSPLVGSAAGS